MESRAKVLGHPVHQASVVLPAGLFLGSALFDAYAMVADRDEGWATNAHRMMGAGIVTGMVAAPFGVIDWMAIPSGTRAKRVGAVHAIVNIAALAAFTASWLSRRDDPEEPSGGARALSFGAAAALSVGAWLGGELVNRLGVGVSERANLDAPSSLKEGEHEAEDDDDSERDELRRARQFVTPS